MVVRRGYCEKVVIIRFDVGKRRLLFFRRPLGNKDSRRHSDYRKGEIPGEFVAAQNHRKHRAQRAFKRQNKRNFRRVDCLLRARLNDISKRCIQHAQGEKRKDNGFRERAIQHCFAVDDKSDDEKQNGGGQHLYKGQRACGRGLRRFVKDKIMDGKPQSAEKREKVAEVQFRQAAESQTRNACEAQKARDECADRRTFFVRRPNKKRHHHDVKPRHQRCVCR